MSDVTPVFEFTDESEGDSVDVCRDSKRGLYVACDMPGAAYASCYITDAVAESMALALIQATPGEPTDGDDYFAAMMEQIARRVTEPALRVRIGLALIRAARKP